ncbi:MAG: Gfo/Idh/MocA family oxidoreductase [Lachnospiraceae bacterium]|nr:Gfo/Idh/MocA family oxidoreductase [Lachnospiraceae bacterium]
MTPYFRVAMIGTGRIAQVIASALAKSKDMKIVAAASRERERAEIFARKNHISAVYDSYDALIDADGYDLIYISTVNPTHFEIAKKCLAAKKAVLIEKPACLTLSEVQELITLSESTGTFFAEAMPIRYASGMRRVIELIESDAIGQVRLLMSNIGINSWSVERIRSKELGGGALYDLGVYGITLSDMLFPGLDGDIRSLSNPDNGVDAQSSVIISYPGAQSILFNSVKLQTKGCAVIYGDKGRIFIKKAYSAERIVKFAGFRHISIYRSKKSRYLEEFESCMRAVSAGKREPAEYPHAQILKTYGMLEKIQEDWSKL